jgi:hypothetical protein
MFILDDILLAPLKGVVWFGKKVAEVVEHEEYLDENNIKEQLMELQMKFELDEVSEEEYITQEQKLLHLLDAA